MRSTYIALSMVVVAVASAACGSSSTSPTLATPTAPTTTVTLINEVLTGTVAPPVNGVLQTAQNTFVVGQGGGTVSVTLTSAVETFPDGTFLPTVTMGLGVGTLTGNTCTIGAFLPAQASATAQLSGTLAVGTYCVQVSDVSNQLGPVLYAVAVSHP